MNTEFFNQLRRAHQQGIFASFIRNSASSGTLFEAIPQLRGLDQIPQDPRWHPEGDVWTHTLLVIENLPTNATFAMSLAALLHDTGKASTTKILETGAITAHGHEEISADLALSILDSFNTDVLLKEEVVFLVRYHMMAHNKDTTVKSLRRLIRKGGSDLVDQLLQHGVADVAGGCRDFTECERLRNLFDQISQEPEKIAVSPILNGDEIMEITGLKPGPEVGRMIQYLSSFGNINREQAINILLHKS